MAITFHKNFNKKFIFFKTIKLLFRNVASFEQGELNVIIKQRLSDYGNKFRICFLDILKK